MMMRTLSSQRNSSSAMAMAACTSTMSLCLEPSACVFSKGLILMVATEPLRSLSIAVNVMCRSPCSIDSLAAFDRWRDVMTSQEMLVAGTRVDMRGKAIRDAFPNEQAVKEGGVEGAWDPATRAREMDRDGVAGEVVFPDGLYQNGVPFHGMGSLDPAANAYPYELRLAGCRAYNRWLVDLSAANPGRHACIALVPFDDVDVAVREIEWARDAGLFGGILLPGLPLSTTDPTWMLHHPRYEPIWSACEALDLPVNIHSTGSGVDYGELPGSRWIHTTEAYWASRRPIWHLLWSGV